MKPSSPSTYDDCLLVEALQAGSEEAFRELFNKYYQKIYRVSVRMGLNKEDAEEIVQEVFLLVWKQRCNLRSDLSFNAFLLTLTKRLVVKQIRHTVVMHTYHQRTCQQQSVRDTSTEAIIIANDLEVYALGYIEAMPPARQEILRLSKQEGLTNDEIAQRLHLSKRTVENQLYRAVKSIKYHLKQEDTLPPTAIGVLLVELLL